MTSANSSSIVAPGQWLGIVGGGQLGRMFCHAAQSLGFKVAVLDPAAQCPAGDVADQHIQAAYDDAAALAQLGALCPAVTTEFENVPAASLRLLAQHSRVSPSADAVALVQDRILEKAFIAGAGVPVAPYTVVAKPSDLDGLPDTLFPGILKAARLGYDGKGQARVASHQEALAAWQALGSMDCVLEAWQPLAFEISVVLARGADGQTVVYPPAVNEHRNGILAVSAVGEGALEAAIAAGMEPALRQAELTGMLLGRAAEAALGLAQALDYVGVMCVEFFVLADGTLIANEIAPRPHNSGHYSMDACVAGQFEQQARAMAGLPLGVPNLLCPSFMLNILGDVWFDADSQQREPDWAAVLRVPGARLHLYGKAEARPGRKMGHVNVLGATLADAQRSAAAVAQALGIAFKAAP